MVLRGGIEYLHTSPQDGRLGWRVFEEVADYEVDGITEKGVHF